jgi:hypothetical protein
VVDRVKPIYQRKPHGHIIVDGIEVADTLQCCHCNGHFVPVEGSGIRRGWCPSCSQVTCGAPACMVCFPWEKQMEAMERLEAIRLKG